MHVSSISQSCVLIPLRVFELQSSVFHTIPCDENLELCASSIHQKSEWELDSVPQVCQIVKISFILFVGAAQYVIENLMQWFRFWYIRKFIDRIRCRTVWEFVICFGSSLSARSDGYLRVCIADLEVLL